MIKATFIVERETKGAIRFQEVDAEGKPVDFAAAAIGTLYIRKSAFKGNGAPATITVTVEG